MYTATSKNGHRFCILPRVLLPHPFLKTDVPLIDRAVDKALQLVLEVLLGSILSCLAA